MTPGSEGFRPLRNDGAGVWLVLGGGALKGLAHVGVWRALEERGVPIAGIVGTSVGAIVGAALAGGRTVNELIDEARLLNPKDIVRVNHRVKWIGGVRQRSVFRGDSLQRFVRRFLGELGWDDMSVPFATNAVDLASGAPVWFGHAGDRGLAVGEAVYASSALPVLYPPFEYEGRYLVDGGLVDTLPIARAIELGAESVVAVNAGAGPEADAIEVLAHGLVGLNQRMFVIMSEQKRRETLARGYSVPVLSIRPELEGEEGFDFSRIDYFLEEGYRAGLAALETESRDTDRP